MPRPRTAPADQGNPPLTAEAKVEIARRYIEGATQKALAAEYRVSAPTINRAVREAREQKWIRVNVTTTLALPPPEQDEDLARTLLARLDSVANLIVLKNPPLPKQGDSSYPQRSDELHRRLGRCLAGHVRSAILDGDRIGISSGRGVHHTIDGIVQDHPLINAKGVHLLSLTGSFEMKGQSADDQVVMDGDKNVGHFAMAFSRQTTILTCGRELTIQANETRPECLSSPLTRALVGVGVSEASNRLFRQSPALKPIAGLLLRLKKLVDTSSTESYVPCADVCNRLFWVGPPKGTLVPKEAELRKLIDEINSRLCAVSLDHLKSTIHGVWIAAGSPRKAHALLQLLEEGLRVNALCIDSTLAEELVRACHLR